MRTYPVVLEIAGPLAMFSRPDTGASPTSYPVPTWSAAKGILEAIAYRSSGEAWFDPVRVEICRHRDDPGGMIRYQAYAWNYGGPLRKEQNIRAGTGMQVFATAIAHPCYRIHAEIRGDCGGARRNPRHCFQDLFQTRLADGQCFKTPALGLSEFTAEYWGPPRIDWVVDTSLNLTIPSMLRSVWDKPQLGRRIDRFIQRAEVRQGQLSYGHSL